MERRSNGKIIFTALAALTAIIYLSKNKFMNWIKPVTAKITSPYGIRRHPVTKEEHFHNGIDLLIPEGTPIQAPADGTVLNVYKNDIGGLQIIISHAGGFKTGYAHLSASLVKTGDKVLKGQTFAKSGKSGRVTSAHLHFTLRNGEGEFLNPENFIYTQPAA
jgi:murein DD-endopeptidase MepM/ murein hydrolase activator NlpD